MGKANHKSQVRFNPSTEPLLIVLSGPSGAGKDAVLNRMKQLGYPLAYITTATTRPRRPEEKNIVDYHFVSVAKFQRMLKKKEFLEYANVYGNWYGVPKEPVKQSLNQGRDTIIKVDTQGANTLKRLVPEAVFIFLVPPSVEELAERLKTRSTESAFDLALRIKTAEEELKQLLLFDYKVINRWNEIDLTISHVEAIITAEKCRVNHRKIALQD